MGKRQKSSVRRIAIGALLGCAAGLFSLLVSARPVFRDFEDLTYDWRLRATARPAEARDDIVLVLINESSVRELEPIFGRWPWPRLAHAGVIDFLSRAGARVIAYDVLFLERDRTTFEIAGQPMTGAESDAALVDAVARAGNVILLADAVHEGMEGDSPSSGSRGPLESRELPASQLPGFPVRPGFQPPFDELAGAALGLGHNYVVKGTRDTARSMAPFVEWQGLAVPSLGTAAALAAARVPAEAVRREGQVVHLDDRRMPLLPSAEALLNFHGPYRTADGASTYEEFPFFNVLLSEDQIQRGEPPAIDSAAFQDKIVFVGTSADGMADIWTSPFDVGGMPGVQLHAAQTDDLLSGRFMARASPAADATLTIAAGVLAGVAAASVPVAWAVAIVGALSVALAVWLTSDVGSGLWRAAIAPVGAAAVALFEGVAWQYFVEGREKRRVTRLFGRYVSKDVFDHLMAEPGIARLGGARREMTVLFSDIRGFTAASERGEPEAVVQQLNEYFTVMVEVLFRHRGTLDKFVGDMVMGLFGAPMADPHHADHAVAAALEMCEVLERLNERWRASGRPPVEIGIGISSGEMIAGNIGSDAVMSYTVIGDAVNLGARLESMTKEFGSRILITEETRRRLTAAVPTRLVGNVAVKGRTEPATVHEVVTS